MERIYQLLTVVCTIAAMILLAGCGQPATGGTPALPTVTTTPSSSASKSPTPPANTGKVTLQVDAQSYRSNDTISVTLKNQSNQTIYFPDHLTGCSVILLQRLPVQPLSGDSGQAGINPCRSEIVTRMHSLAAGQNLVVRLLAPSNGWLPGFYHATLIYHTSFNKPTAIYTAAFTISPFTPQP